MKKSLEIWHRFMRLPGARVGTVVGIAAAGAIEELIALIINRRPRRILELGSGIGTLTYTILDTVYEANISTDPSYRFYTIESEPFCISQLEINLKQFQGAYHLVHSIDEIPRNFHFDLIVVDGGGDLPNDLGVIDFSGRLAPHGIILLEGGRGFQRDRIMQWYGRRSNVIAKIIPVNKTLDTGMEGVVAKQKPFRLFLFEPSLGQRLRLTLRDHWCWLRDRLKKWHTTFALTIRGTPTFAASRRRKSGPCSRGAVRS